MKKSLPFPALAAASQGTSGDDESAKIEPSFSDVAGEWSAWSPFGPCQMDCNATFSQSSGVSISTRRCQQANFRSRQPKSGSKLDTTCSGSNRRYKLCTPGRQVSSFVFSFKQKVLLFA